MDTKLPIIEPSLLNYLDTLHPERCPSPDMTEREIWMAAGARQLVRKLHDLADEHNENLLGA